MGIVRIAAVAGVRFRRASAQEHGANEVAEQSYHVRTFRLDHVERNFEGCTTGRLEDEECHYNSSMLVSGRESDVLDFTDR